MERRVMEKFIIVRVWGGGWHADGSTVWDWVAWRQTPVVVRSTTQTQTGSLLATSAIKLVCIQVIYFF